MGDSLDHIVESSEAERLGERLRVHRGASLAPGRLSAFCGHTRQPDTATHTRGEPEVVRENSGGSNGLTFDLQGGSSSARGGTDASRGWRRTARSLPSPSGTTGSA